MGKLLLKILQCLCFISTAAQNHGGVCESPKETKQDLLSSLDSVRWQVPIGCDYSGFFVEALGFAIGFNRLTVEELVTKEASPAPQFFLDVGKCSQSMLASMGSEEASLLSTYQSKGFIQKSNLGRTIEVHHKPPGVKYPPKSPHSLLYVGRQMTESIYVSPQEVIEASKVDILWVPSNFHKRTFADAGVEESKIHVLHEPVDTFFFSPTANNAVEEAVQKQKESEKTRFLSIFKFEHRKGWDVLLKAYWSEFARSDNVELVLRSYKPSWLGGDHNLERVISNFAMTEFKTARSELPPVILESRELSREELRLLYARSNAFVLPTRGEGWGLPVVEAFSMGLPVICTNFSGPTEYLKTSHSFPVRVLKINQDGTGEPDVSDVQKHLRTVQANRTHAQDLGEAARLYAVTNFDPIIIAREAIASLNTVLQGMAVCIK